MSYSGNVGPSGFTGRGPHPGAGTRTFPVWRWVSAWVVAAVWLLFTLAAISAPAVLDEIWVWAAGLPIFGQLIVWVVALPWMIGIAIVRSDLPTFVQVLLVIAAAIISIWTFAPTSRDR